jgi:death on curing protein
MIAERLQHLIDEIAALPPEEQDRVAAAVQLVLRQPAVN